MTRVPQNRGQFTCGPYLFVAALAVLAITTFVVMEVYRKADTVPAEDIQYVCNTTMGCTGEPVIAPFILALVAAGALAIVLRFGNQRAHEQDRGR